MLSNNGALHFVLTLLTSSISDGTLPAESGLAKSSSFDSSGLTLLQLHANVERRNNFSFESEDSDSSSWGASKKCWEKIGKDRLTAPRNGTLVPLVTPDPSSMILLEVRERKVNRPAKGNCLGDLCIRPPYVSLTALNVSLRRAKATPGHKQIPAACPKQLPEGKRLVLVPVVPSYHSSTALEQVLMSSPRLATLCAAGTWQCEGQWIRDELQEKVKRLHPYSLVWDLKRPVFFDKLPGFGGIELDHYYIEPWLTEPIPPTMTEVGIQSVDLGYLLMWRPVCLAQMSSHAIENILNGGVHKYAARELMFLENTTLSYRKLVERDLPVMVVNLGDMLWAPEISQPRLEGFLPCLGRLDFDFVPEVGKDISSCNMWKADGSVKAFGETVEPKERYGYDVGTGECDDRFDLFEVLETEERERAKAAVSELLSLSRLHTWAS